MRLEVDGLNKTYRTRRGTITALQDVSFTLESGEIVGLLGINGAGKTTTIKSTVGLIYPDSGSVSVDGKRVDTSPRVAATHMTALLEGNRNLYWRLSAQENIDFFAGLHGRSRREVKPLRDELLAELELETKARTEARRLSRGMQQKLALACVLARGTPFLLLDEPTLGLDVAITAVLRQRLRTLATEGRGILLSSHDMGVVQSTCDRVIVVAGGRVIAFDDVANLLKFFGAQALELTLDRAINAEDLRVIQARFPLAAADEAVLRVDFAESKGFYDLADILRGLGFDVVDITRKEPDLEQIFLRLVGENL